MFLMAAIRSGTKLKEIAYEKVAYHLVRSRAWDQVPPLASLALRQTLRITPRLLNWRIKALVHMKEFGYLDSALDGFRQRNLNPGPETYHLLMEGHIRNNNLPQSRESIDWMVQAGFPISTETQARLITVFSETIGPSTEIESLAAASFYNAKPPFDAKILNGLIRARLAAGDVGEAFRYLSFFDLSSKDLEYLPFTNLRSRGDSARRPPPNGVTYHMLLKFFLQRREMVKYHSALDAFFGRRLPMDGSFAALAIRAAMVSGDMHKAVCILRKLCWKTPKAVLYLSRIAKEPVDLPWEFSRNLQSLQPDCRVFNAFLKEWLPRNGLRHVHLLLRAMDVAVGGFDDRSISILTQHISCYRGVSPIHILRILRHVVNLWGVSLDNRSFEAILSSAIRLEVRRMKGRTRSSSTENLGALSEYLLTSRDRLNFPNLQPERTPILPSLEQQYLTLLLESLHERCIRLSLAGLALRLRYQAMIRLDLQTAEHSLAMMRKQGLPINAFHYAALVEGYVAVGEMEAAQRLTKLYGQQPRAVVLHTILIHGYARRREAKMAQLAFENMLQQQILPDWAAINALVGAWRRIRRLDIARGVLLEAVPLLPEINPAFQHVLQSGLDFLSLQEEFKKLRYANHPHVVELKTKKARFNKKTQNIFNRVFLHLLF